jgi:hypothetical protein
MIHRSGSSIVNCLLALLWTAAVCFAQASDLERRVQALEEKMRQLDPAFRSGTAQSDLETRLAVLEKKMDSLLAVKAPVPTAPVTPPVEPPTTSPVQAVSITGDYQASGEGETRLPVAGYMDFHVNKDRGDAVRPD